MNQRIELWLSVTCHLGGVTGGTWGKHDLHARTGLFDVPRHTMLVAQGPQVVSQLIPQPDHLFESAGCEHRLQHGPHRCHLQGTASQRTAKTQM